MAQLDFRIDLTEPLHRGMIKALVDLVNSLKRYRCGVILGLLKSDPVTRALLAEDFGERVVALVDMGDEDASWDEVMLKAIDHVADGPGARGEIE